MNPIRLQWNIPDECIKVIDNSLRVAQAIAQDVDLHIEVGILVPIVITYSVVSNVFIRISADQRIW